MEVDDGAQRRPKRVLRLIVVLVLLGLISHGTFAGTGDEAHYLAMAHSIAFDRDLDLSNNYGPNEPLIAAGELQPENHVRAGVGGVTRPIHDAGMPLLAAPIVWMLRPAADWLARTVPPQAMQRAKLTPTVLYRHGISIVMIAIAVWLAGLLFETCLRLGAPSRTAFGAALLVSLSPPLLIHSALFFTELLTAFLCTWVFARVAGLPRLVDPWLPPSSLDVARDALSDSRRAGGSPPELQRRRKPEATNLRWTTNHRWTWAATGAVTGLLMLIHARNVGLVLAFALLGGRAAWRIGGRSLAAFAGGLAALLLLRTAINMHFWGTLVTTPHAALGEMAPAVMGREVATRLGGMLLDQEFGLLIYAPIYVLAFLGVVFMPDRGVAHRVTFVSACYLVPVLLPITNVHGWTGGWSPAGRFMMPIVPLLALALPWTLRHTPRPVLAVLLALQLGIDAYMWQNPKNLWNDGDGTAAVCARSGLAICRYLPSFVKR